MELKVTYFSSRPHHHRPIDKGQKGSNDLFFLAYPSENESHGFRPDIKINLHN